MKGTITRLTLVSAAIILAGCNPLEEAGKDVLGATNDVAQGALDALADGMEGVGKGLRVITGGNSRNNNKDHTTNRLARTPATLSIATPQVLVAAPTVAEYVVTSNVWRPDDNTNCSVTSTISEDVARSDFEVACDGFDRVQCFELESITPGKPSAFTCSQNTTKDVTVEDIVEEALVDVVIVNDFYAPTAGDARGGYITTYGKDPVDCGEILTGRRTVEGWVCSGETLAGRIPDEPAPVVVPDPEPPVVVAPPVVVIPPVIFVPPQPEPEPEPDYGVDNSHYVFDNIAMNNFGWTANPGGVSWMDSYSIVAETGKEYCFMDTTLDHNIGELLIELPEGGTIKAKDARNQQANHIFYRNRQDHDPIYNDMQCGNGPANDFGDEDTDKCPGRVDLGGGGCGIQGPRFTLVK